MVKPKNQVSIKLEKCKVPQEKASFVRKKVNSLAPLILGENLHFLKQVSIVRNNLIKSKAQEYLGKEIQTKYNKSFALIKETTESIECKIMLGCNTASGNDLSLLSTIAEELIHVQTYIEIWKQYGHTQFGFSFVDPCVNDLLGHTFPIIDEFLAGRKKLSYLPPVRLFYGRDLVELVDLNVEIIINSLHQRFADEVTHEVALGQIINSLYTIFDALARDRALISDTQAPNAFNYDMSSSVHFGRIEPFWLRVYSDLVNSLQGVGFIEPALNSMTSTVIECLESFGLTFSATEENDCWVEYHMTS